jgi:hypothetical protein
LGDVGEDFVGAVDPVDLDEEAVEQQDDNGDGADEETFREYPFFQSWFDLGRYFSSSLCCLI